MEALTGNNLLTFAVVLLALVAVWNTMWSGYKNYKEAKKPHDDLRSTINDHSKMLHRDNERLRELEECNRLLLRAFSVILEHEITGNHIESLVQVKNDINDFLINR